VTLAPADGTVTVPGVVARAERLEGEVRVPADKSVAHRALLFTAMSLGRATVTLDRPGADIRSMAGALATLGAVKALAEDGEGTLRATIHGGGESGQARLPGGGGETLDCGNAGTAMRLLAGALGGRPASATLVGDASLSMRPMERIAAPLRRTGVQVETTDGHAPLHIVGTTPLAAVEHDVPVASAQVIGSLVLAGLAADGRTTIRVPGPTRDHTERMLAWLGVPIRREGLATTLDGPAGYGARDIRVPGDISSAAAWLVAGALHPDASIELRDVGLNPSRVGIIDVLREMGADIEVRPVSDHTDHPEPVGHVRVRGGHRLRAIELHGDRVADVIDELPLIGVAMAAAEGTSELRDAGELRVKESDRIALVVENLGAIGARVEERQDGWVVASGGPREAAIRTGGDHRIAMAFAIAALTGVAGTVRVDDPGCAAVSYPGFWSDLAALAR
jgi:3-phosphoshikimate 1-carboxyvinyltransferase